MDTKEWLSKVGYRREHPELKTNVWLSKFDDSYIAHTEMPEEVDFLAKLEITEELTHGVGFSPKDNKWYGWSHRAIYGFTIGSTCKKGDCHYQPKDKDDFLEAVVNFWSDKNNLNTKGRHGKQEILHYEPIDIGHDEQKPIHTGKFEEGVHVEWTYATDIPNKKLRYKISGVFNPYPKEYGRGEWVAKTMEDAKQMAIDFNEGVS